MLSISFKTEDLLTFVVKRLISKFVTSQTMKQIITISQKVKVIRQSNLVR